MSTDDAYNKASVSLLEAESIRERAQAALWLIQAGWNDKVVADVVGLPGLNAEGSRA